MKHQSSTFELKESLLFLKILQSKQNFKSKPKSLKDDILIPEQGSGRRGWRGTHRARPWTQKTGQWEDCRPPLLTNCPSTRRSTCRGRRWRASWPRRPRGCGPNPRRSRRRAWWGIPPTPTWRRGRSPTRSDPPSAGAKPSPRLQVILWLWLRRRIFYWTWVFLREKKNWKFRIGGILIVLIEIGDKEERI